MDDQSRNPAEGDKPAAAREFPREEFLGLLRAGIWPQDALAYLRVSRAQWKRERERDPALCDDTRRAIAAVHLIHMRNLHEKIQQADDWRGSAWWLAQRFPNRYGGGRQGKEVERAVENIVQTIDESLRAEFNTPGELERVGRVFSHLGKG